MKKWLAAVLFGTVLVLGACGGDNAEEPADTNDDTTTETDEAAEGGESVATAEDVYEANCAGCHGADLSGGVGPELTTIGSKYSEEELTEIITQGIGSMPAQKVEGEDLDALTAWLSEQQ